MEVFAFWLGLAIAVAVYADYKGKSGPTYFALSLLLSPLVGLIILVIRSQAKPASPEVRGAEQTHADVVDRRPCPFCAELIKNEAVKCRYCGSDLQTAPQATDATVGAKQV